MPLRNAEHKSQRGAETHNKREDLGCTIAWFTVFPPTPTVASTNGSQDLHFCIDYRDCAAARLSSSAKPLPKLKHVPCSSSGYSEKRKTFFNAKYETFVWFSDIHHHVMRRNSAPGKNNAVVNYVDGKIQRQNLECELYWSIDLGDKKEPLLYVGL